MSWARWGPKSEVYVYEAADGWRCHVTNGMTFTRGSAESMAEALAMLRSEGVKVPDGLIEDLIEEGQSVPGDGG